jgi:hypothetical protein
VAPTPPPPLVLAWRSSTRKGRGGKASRRTWSRSRSHVFVALAPQICSIERDLWGSRAAARTLVWQGF